MFFGFLSLFLFMYDIHRAGSVKILFGFKTTTLVTLNEYQLKLIFLELYCNAMRPLIQLNILSTKRINC